MSNITLDWNAIRPLNGGREKGFEELCSQLARDVCPPNAKFIRKGTPDAGVECYVVLQDGTEWGWQAKYFHSIGKSQWSQIDKSVQAAIDKHPRMTRYFVCIPTDLPDGRLTGQKSAKVRWDERVVKWQGWASEKGLCIEFVLWGGSELLNRLATDKNAGRVRFWFGEHRFNNAWFFDRFEEARKTAGPRYTPELHVKLPIAQTFEAFGRTPRFFDQLRTLALPIRDGLRTVRYSNNQPSTNDIDKSRVRLENSVRSVLDGFAVLNASLSGNLSFQPLLELLEIASSDVQRVLDLWTSHEEILREERALDEQPHSAYRQNASAYIYPLLRALTDASSELKRSEKVAGNDLLILKGDAGMGKTHLFCDIARKRLEEGKRTILLMGQRLISEENPWTQICRQLDLPGLSQDEFVGILEAAAQASGERALLLIDAVNEGKGRTLWPNHLAAFLSHFEGSDWVSVALSVRTSYETVVLPPNIRNRAFIVEHRGFESREYDAVKNFFKFFDLELPNAPLFGSEFKNPLFLKVLCDGLRSRNMRRFPRGTQGITATFGFYLDAVNQRLSEALDFNPRQALVRDALEAIALHMAESNERWLSLAKASEIVDGLLPGRSYSNSLYRGLVVEGVLVEDASGLGFGESAEMVRVVYERLADHLVVSALLEEQRECAESSSWEHVFAGDNRLTQALTRESIPYGFLEALSIQVPEWCGRELAEFLPGNRPFLTGHAFRQSLVWRSHDAYSDSTHCVLNELCENQGDFDHTLEILLTLATIPENQFNMVFLDARLRQDVMAERDAWWSIFIHSSWESEGIVHRLVDWAWDVRRDNSLKEEFVRLYAKTLAWMFTSSNRFLRDRATSALVALLTGKLEVAGWLVEQFVDVDDLYVLERVCAVAYGVAMRCHNADAVGELARCVYHHIFASNSPPTHILLRDYARGVIERALFLDSDLGGVNEELVRPPYGSVWPDIPSEEDIEPFQPDWSRGAYDSGELEWSRNVIGTSVMSGDFARYVLGAESNWLSLRLDEPIWVPPKSADDLEEELLIDLSQEERAAFDEVTQSERRYEVALAPFIRKQFDQWELDHPDEQEPRYKGLTEAIRANTPPELVKLEEFAQQARERLEEVLTPAHLELLEELESRRTDYQDQRAPRFDMQLARRYVLKQVFDLGWTVDRFGWFDRYSVGNNAYRSASKVERFGKKYQWIAYHEILACLADNFQYLERFREDCGDRAYDGPWQHHWRDIDPSCVSRSRSEPPDVSVRWWEVDPCPTWNDQSDLCEWIVFVDDLPRVDDMLRRTDPHDGTRWLNGGGRFSWSQRTPADQRSYNVEHGSMWTSVNCYLIRQEDADSFLQWAETVDFDANQLPGGHGIGGLFLGEHCWSSASRYVQQPYFGDYGWMKPDGCPVDIHCVGLEYRCEAGSFDCTLDETYEISLPTEELVERLDLRWAGHGADFVDGMGDVITKDPSTSQAGSNTLLIRLDALLELQERDSLTVCWTVSGGKALHSASSSRTTPDLRISGAYILDGETVRGFEQRTHVYYEKKQNDEKQQVKRQLCIHRV